jgi:hypothetical protein
MNYATLGTALNVLLMLKFCPSKIYLVEGANAIGFEHSMVPLVDLSEVFLTFRVGVDDPLSAVRAQKYALADVGYPRPAARFVSKVHRFQLPGGFRRVVGENSVPTSHE